jgi:hypothetical protein
MALLQGSKTTNAGTRAPLVATTVTTPTSRFCARVTIYALPGNTNKVYVGDASVSSTAYAVRLSAGESYTIGMGETRGNSTDLATIYIDVDTNGEGVKFGAEQV